MAYIMSLNFEIGGVVDRAELESAASGIMKHLVNRGLVTNDLSEDELLEAYWVEVSPTNGEATEQASTPGPWSFDGHGINSSEGERIAKVQHDRHCFAPSGKGLVLNERFDADSKLIAKAWHIPDLVNCIGSLVAMVKDIECGGSDWFDWQGTLEYAVELVARVEAA